MVPATCEPTPVLPVSRKPPGSVQVPLENGQGPALAVSVRLARLCCCPCLLCARLCLQPDDGGGAALPCDVVITGSACQPGMAPGITTSAIFSVTATVNPENLLNVTIQVTFARVLWPSAVLTCQNAAAQCEQWPRSISQPAVDPSGHSDRHLGERHVVASLHSLSAWNSRLTRECTQHTILPTNSW